MNILILLLMLIASIHPLHPSADFTRKRLTPAYSAATNAMPQYVSCNRHNNVVAIVNPTANTVQTFKIQDAYGRLSSAVSTQSTGLIPTAVAWSPSGNLLAVVNWGDDTVQMFSVDESSGSITSLVSSRIVGSGPIAISFSPNGRFIAIMNYYAYGVAVFGVDRDGNVSDQVGWQNILPNTQGTSIAFSPKWSSSSGGFLVATSYQAVQIFKLTRAGILSSVSLQNIGANHASWSPSGRLLAISTFDGKVSILRVSSHGRLSIPLSSQTTTLALNGVAWSPLGNAIAAYSGDSSHSLRIYPVNSHGKLYRAVQNLDTGAELLSLAWKPAGNLLLVTTRDGRLKTFTYR